jgi:hypothetical protein
MYLNRRSLIDGAYIRYAGNRADLLKSSRKAEAEADRS